MTPRMPLVGEELAGYRLRAVLGRGGMSVVYEAENARLGSIVAIKVLASELASDDLFRTRFIQESRVAASLNHPNVIPIFDAGPCDDLLYISMRYVAGADLRTVLKAHGLLAPDQSLLLVGQAGRALDAAHRMGLVHRDVKPANFLVERGVEDEPDHVYLADFGITKHARSRSGLTATGQFVGTIDYIAPEQIQGKPVDGRTDIYSLGCVLYECLTGRVPFKKDLDAAVIWAHVEELPKPPSEIRSELPKTIDRVIFRALAKDPDDRFNTCREFIGLARSALQPTRPRRITPTAEALMGPPTVLTAETVSPAAPHVPVFEMLPAPRTAVPARHPGPILDRAVPTGPDPGHRAVDAAGGQPPSGEPPAPRSGGGPRSRWLIPLAVLVLVLAAGVGVWAASRGASSKPSRSAKASSSAAAPGNPILVALASANKASGGLLPRSTCTMQSASMVTCSSPAGGISTVSFRTFPSLNSLYAAYVAEVTSLTHLPLKTNVSDCTRHNPSGEVSWNHDGHHPRIYSLAQLRANRLTPRSKPLDEGSQAGGRVFCKIGPNGQLQLVWTQNAGQMLGILEGGPHETAWDWWHSIHHDISFPSAPGSDSAMSK